MLSASHPGDRSALPSVLTLALFEDSGCVGGLMPLHIQYRQPNMLSCTCITTAVCGSLLQVV